MANKATSAPAATQAAGPQEPKAPGLFEIGELRKKHKVGRAVFAAYAAPRAGSPAGPSPRRSSSQRSRILRTPP